MFHAIYRQLRPRRFDEIIGQPAVTQTLKNQIISGRINHAYLFCGTRGTGKTSTARVLSRVLTCLSPNGADPCEVCPACTASRDDATMDIIEMDAASNRSINDIRALRDGVAYPPQMGKRKIYIIDEVHALSADAFGALLKTLEEPPDHAVFILATTEPQKLPATILSRCQRFDFRRITTREIAALLERACEGEGAAFEKTALFTLAKAAEGSMRDALSLLDRCISTGKGHVSDETVMTCLGSSGRDFLFKFADLCAKSDLAGCFSLIDELIMSGREIPVFIRELTDHMRNLLVAQTAGGAAPEILGVSPQDAQRLTDQAAEIGSLRALRAMELLTKAEGELRLSSQPRVLLELAIVRICMPETHDSAEALKERLERLEKAVNEGNIIVRESKASPPPKAQPPKAEIERQEKPASFPPKAPGASVWKEVLAAIKKDKIRLFVSLSRASLDGINESTAAVRFPDDQSIHMATCQKDESKAAIEEAFSKAAGRPIKVEFISGGGKAAPVLSAKEGYTLEKAVKDTFGADMVEIVD